ncbi:MAG: hypothetical protein WAM15_04565, partial [Candidatus Acidiferrales bacterium]
AVRPGEFQHHCRVECGVVKSRVTLSSPSVEPALRHLIAFAPFCAKLVGVVGAPEALSADI